MSESAAIDKTKSLSDLRIPVRIIEMVNPRIHQDISQIPARYRSERMRTLMEKGLLYEEQCHLLQCASMSSASLASPSAPDDEDDASQKKSLSDHQFL